MKNILVRETLLYILDSRQKLKINNMKLLNNINIQLVTRYCSINVNNCNLIH